MSFLEYPATKKLAKLAQHPFDLTKPLALSPERVRSMQIHALGLTLMYGTERVDDTVMRDLFELAKEAKAVEKMRNMQHGDIINKIEGYESENRRVLHTAMRDFFHHPETEKPAKEAREEAYKEVEKLKVFCERIHNERTITDIVQIGIGGSDLGPKAIYLAMQAYQKKEVKVHFLSNVDPDDFASILADLNLKTTLVVVVSKSGSTLETLTNEQLIRKAFEERGINPGQHVIAVTGKGSPMDDPKKYLASFYMWDYVGGRYSVTSMVGGVTLALSVGFDHYMSFLKGASEMDKLAQEKDPKKNLPLFGALLGIWNRNFLHYPTLAIIPYSHALQRFTAHLQQCDMESNGKHITMLGERVKHSTGPIIWGEPGTNGQHSFYQLIHQGSDIIPLEFIGFKHSQRKIDMEVKGTTSQEKLLSNLFAQSIGFATGKHHDNPNKRFEGNRPNHVLLAKECDPQTLGKILSYYEHKVAFQGFIWGINSFDQEGVQLGKVLANQILDLFAKKRSHKTIDPAEFPLGQAYMEWLS